MTTGVLLTPPVVAFAFNNGQLAAGGYVQFTVGGTLTAIYADSGLTTPLPNPVPLNSRGEISNAAGASCQCFLQPNIVYVATLFDGQGATPPTFFGNQIWQATYVNGVQIPATQAGIGAILYPQSNAESSALITPTNYGYPWGDVRRYGAVGNGIANDQAAIQNALNVQQDVLIPSGLNCLVSSSLTLRSNQTLYGQGWDSQITCNGSSINAVILTGCTRSIVRDMFIKYTGTFTSGLDSAAVFIGTGASYCTVKGCRLEGTRAGVTINYADRNTIIDNLVSSANGADLGWDIGVYFGGTHNLISRNRCEGGTSAGGTNGIYILSDNTHGCDWNIVSNNDVGTHTQYGILLYSNTPGGTAQHNTVVGNIVHDITGTYNSGSGQAYGAGIYVAGAEWTTIIGNFLYNTNISTNTVILAPGAIGVLGTSCFSVVGNIIRAPVWSGIYVVTDGNLSGSGLVEGNVITSPGKDGIFLSAISNVSVIGNAVTGGTQNGISYTNSAPGTGISIQSNKVKLCAAGNGIIVTQTQCPNISGNYVAANSTGLNLTNTTGGIILGNEFRNNTGTDVFADNTNSGLIHLDRNTVRSAATNGVNDSFGFTYGINDVAGQTNPYAGSIPYQRTLATSATPSVAGSLSVQYGGATAITDFLNGYPGQRVTVLANGNITLNNNAGAAGTKLMMRAGANLSLTANQTATFELLPGGPWYQVN
jgi:parallel beta-helix repeat protein